MCLLASSCTNQCQLYYILEKPLAPGALGLNAFNHPGKFQVNYVFSAPPALIPLVLSKLLVEYMLSQSRLLILVVPCWMEAPWLPTVLRMLEDISNQFPIIKDIVTDDSVGWVLKDLPLLHLTLCLLSDM